MKDQTGDIAKIERRINSSKDRSVEYFSKILAEIDEDKRADIVAELIKILNEADKSNLFMAYQRLDKKNKFNAMPQISDTPVDAEIDDIATLKQRLAAVLQDKNVMMAQLMSTWAELKDLQKKDIPGKSWWQFIYVAMESISESKFSGMSIILFVILLAVFILSMFTVLIVKLSKIFLIRLL